MYTSSVAAYGYHADNPVPLTEDVPPRGSREHYYSEQKAACEAALAEITGGSTLQVYVLRPCIVAGPTAPALADAMPWSQLPGVIRSATQMLPMFKPLFPDPGTPLQLVHHDDVAAAIALAATTSAPPGAYNIAGDGVVSVSDVVAALGGRPVRVPHAAASAASAVIARLPLVPSALEWLHVGRTSVVMDTTKAKSVLGWHPKYTSAQTLAALASAGESPSLILTLVSDASQDLVGGLGPDVGAGVVVPGLDPGADVGVELTYRGVGAAAQFLGGQFGEPALDEVEPG